MTSQPHCQITSLTSRILAVGLLVMLSSAGIAAAAPPPQNGAAAPAFSLSLAANGRGSVSLRQLHGHAVYINFFATWCQPCKAEAPAIAHLAQEFAKHNVVVLGIDELETESAARGFALQYRLPYPIAVDGGGDVGGNYGLIGLPLHVFVGADGRVVMHREGEMTPAQIRAELLKIGR
ncbi:MAG: TlpA family protein disulfide reductase [Candidatus Eremiobacteraeota bacterium]|nr:TlpA family protein disulfide reductase [Candidatus Eremiobacteraeota bacterium]